MKFSMKILFIQLPLMDHSRSYVQGNIEYGPAAIAGYLKLKAAEEVSVQYLPYRLSCFGSNSSIVRYIKNFHPDCISFSCYLWNIERNLSIASAVKKSNENMKIYFGGPEINPQSWALSEKRECVDYFMEGEGEWFFRELLRGNDLGRFSTVHRGNRLIVQPPEALLAPGEIVEPFTARFLNPMYDRTVFMEMTRGCPYRCVYCNYSKNCHAVRELPFRHLLEALAGKTGLAIDEIYILSPTFNTSRDFVPKLRMLEEANRGIRLHTEMRADGIDDGTARLMERAGFRSLEVGLQTLTPSALKEIGRRSDTAREIAGMTALKKAGIELKIGVIPGLPGDDPASFMNTVETMARLGFGDDIELYPLMILPGTGIRDRADRDGVRYQDKPPYHLLEGWGFDLSSLSEIAAKTEAVTGFGEFRRLPDFIFSGDGPVAAISFSGMSDGAWDGALYAGHVESNPFTFFIDLDNGGPLSRGLGSLLPRMGEEDQLYNIIFRSGAVLDERGIADFLLSCEDDHFFRRLSVHREWGEGARVRFYHVAGDVDVYLRCRDLYRLIIPVCRITGDNYRRVLDLDPDESHFILVGKGALGHVKKMLLSNYPDNRDALAFEDEGENREFYDAAGEDYVDIPLAFSIMRF